MIFAATLILLTSSHLIQSSTINIQTFDETTSSTSNLDSIIGVSSAIQSSSKSNSGDISQTLNILSNSEELPSLEEKADEVSGPDESISVKQESKVKRFKTTLKGRSKYSKMTTEGRAHLEPRTRTKYGKPKITCKVEFEVESD